MKELDLWKKCSLFIKPINVSVSKRKTLYAASCSLCQNERYITYAQAHNLITGKNKNICKKCQKYEGNKETRFKKNQKPWNYKKKHVFKKDYSKSKKFLEIVNAFGGIVFTPEIRKKQREKKLGITGEKANAWLGGLTSENKLLRSRDEYKQLRKACFLRDNYTCVLCSKKGVKLHMDHIKEWCNYPDLRFEISNVRTLCVPCHKNTPNYLHRAKRGN